MIERVVRGERSICVLFFSGVLSACSSGAMESSQPPPVVAPASAVPESATISGGSVRVGVSIGRFRENRTVSAFRIAKYPITVEQFQQCVDAKVCSEPSGKTTLCRIGKVGIDRPTFGTDAPASAPVTCVDESNARAFCSWVGGRLPTVDEWLLAARGPEVQRWVWGNEPPTCDRNWRVGFDPDGNASCCGKDCESMDVISASLSAGLPHGAHMDRVLATHGELVAPSTQGRTLGCVSTSSACYVSGTRPGAIDFVSQAADFADVASFRCAWGGAS